MSKKSIIFAAGCFDEREDMSVSCKQAGAVPRGPRMCDCEFVTSSRFGHFGTVGARNGIPDA